MQLLEKIRENAIMYPERIAVLNRSLISDNDLTYQQLDQYSNRLACYIRNNAKQEKEPIIVYGHKSPYMLVAFLACVKAGHPYCPIDISNPYERIIDIIEEVNSSIVFSMEKLEYEQEVVIDLETIKTICIDPSNDKDIINLVGLAEDEVFYILFTSGSTGKPKGVEITYGCLNHFLLWTCEIVERFSIENPVFLNQAPFSFDLSVMDLYTNLYMGGTLVMLNKDVQISFPLLIPTLGESHCSVWVSTPSFADMCLSEKKFNDELMPNLKVFLFCGEVLTNATALKLIERFPEATVINTFGPTETTVAVTEQYITKEIANRQEALPIGKPNPWTQIQIWNSEGKPVPANEQGEIVIVGDTVAKGYYNNSKETSRSFINININGKNLRAYKTGDKGFLDLDGVLHYSGRMDKQIKLNGYRIELGDIEKNLMKLQKVSNAAVIPKYKENKVKSLTAFLTLYNPADDERLVVKQIKTELKLLVPEYMVPKKMVVLQVMPMNVNGKVDRKKLEEMV